MQAMSPLPRLVTALLRARLADAPAVAMVGPRQCGKTTLAKMLEAGDYFDLEQEGDRLRLDIEWPRLQSQDRLIILDEAQAWPSVFTRLRGAIDADRQRMGRFLLLGSVSPALMAQVSESLAGRLALVEISPFCWAEVQAALSLDALWLYGGYPDACALSQGRYPHWQLDYLSLLTQRDLPSWGLPARPQTTDRLLRMLAALHGQPWNASQVGQGLGLSYHTVNGYLDYLAGAFLIRRLEPYAANIAKRLVKRPKVYWRDSGLLHALLDVPDRTALLNRPWVGASWEGFVIEQILTQLKAQGFPFQAAYFRTSDQQELDLVLELQGETWAIEVKLSSSPGPDDFAKLQKSADLIGASRRFLISQTAQPSGDAHRGSVDLPAFLDLLPA